MSLLSTSSFSVSYCFIAFPPFSALVFPPLPTLFFRLFTFLVSPPFSPWPSLRPFFSLPSYVSLLSFYPPRLPFFTYLLPSRLPSLSFLPYPSFLPRPYLPSLPHSSLPSPPHRPFPPCRSPPPHPLYRDTAGSSAGSCMASVACVLAVFSGQLFSCQLFGWQKWLLHFWLICICF